MLLKKFVRKLIIPTAGVIVTMPVMLGATEVTFAHTNGKTAEEAVAWVQSYEGEGIDYDGSYGNQCVDLIKAYYDYLGETPVRGNADTYAYNALPEGWQRIQGAEPQPGDILVYTGGSYGHVAIYTGDNESFHQNWGGGYVQRVTGYDFSSMGYWGVIRPDFEDAGDPSYTDATDYEYELSDDYEDSYSMYGSDDDYDDNYSMNESDNDHENNYSYDYDRYIHDGFRPALRYNSDNSHWNNIDDRPSRIR